MIDYFFETAYWPPRWYCGTWTTGLGLTHIISDLFIFSAYFTIPAILMLFYGKLKGLKVDHLFVLFAAFILFCGTTHLIEAIIFYYPVYRFAGLVKALTAAISWVTVLALIPFIKKITAVSKVYLVNQELIDQLGLEQERSLHSYQTLMKKNKALENYSQRLAHDLKEPIRGMSIYANILSTAKGKSDEEIQQKLDRMLDSVVK